MICGVLFLKEWRQNWLLIGFSAVFMVAFLVSDTIYVVRAAVHHAAVLVPEDVRDIVFAVWVLSALFCGSFLSPEADTGTLVFLSSLPIKRSKIFRTKFLSGLFIHVVSVAVSTAILFSFCALTSDAHLMPQAVESTILGYLCAHGDVLLGTADVFALAALMSILIDKAISGIVLTAIVTIGGVIGVTSLSDLLTTAFPIVPGVFWLDALIFLVGICIIYSDYQVFVYGESLRTAKRFLILARVGAVDIGLVVASVAAVYAILNG